MVYFRFAIPWYRRHQPLLAHPPVQISPDRRSSPTSDFILEPGSDVAVLTGVTTANQTIQGSEAIQIVNH
jgi:hypothetical protein